MSLSKESIFEEAKNRFYRNGKRKDIIDFIKASGVEGAAAEELATAAYKEVKGKIHQAIEVKEHQSHGGPVGKILIVLFAIGIGIFGVIALERIFYLIFLFGFGFMGIGVIGLFRNPAKEKVEG